MTLLHHGLVPPATAARLIEAGRPCCVAGDEALLRTLPRGCWIGGTIPYFMAEAGGLCTRESVFVTELPVHGGGPRVARYERHELERICTETPDNGFTLLVLPAFSAVHEAFAQEAPGYPDMYQQPLVGWVAGVHLDELGQAVPRVLDGRTGEALADAALALHVPVDGRQRVHVDIVNLFEQRPGPVFEFDAPGFAAGDCRIDGRPGNLHDWMLASAHDTRLPLVADCCGALVNVSIRRLDAARRRVEFYAPVFPGTPYRPAAPLADYVAGFGQALARQQPPAPPLFSANCILNHVHGALEGKRLGVHGPAAFGEIGYQLLNQTLVYLSLVDA